MQRIVRFFRGLPVLRFQPGAQFAHCEILAFVAVGGIGEVWRARDLKLKREVALKMILESLTKDPDRIRIRRW
jgi:hypothetical protein